MTMTTPLQTGRELQRPEATEALALTVTEGGALVVQMHMLLRQITPVLEQPDSVPDEYRQQLVERTKTLLQGIPEDAMEQEDGYEPGCWREETEEETEREEPW